MPKRITDSDAKAFGERLSALLSDKGRPRRGAGAYLAKRYKVSTVTANAWLNGEYKPGTATARRIATDHGSTFDELYFGAHSPATTLAVRETREDYIRFPLLEGYAGMGQGDYMPDFPEVVEFVEVARAWAEWKLRGTPLQAVRVITGRGDSMRGEFEHGDLIFVDARVKQFVADSAYVFRWHGRVQVKRLQQIGNGLVRILSRNTAYPPVDVPIDELEIGGRALAAWTLREF